MVKCSISDVVIMGYVEMTRNHVTERDVLAQRDANFLTRGYFIKNRQTILNVFL